MQANGTPGVQKLSVKHVEIMNHLLANPMIKLAELAKLSGMSQPWLSCVIHSEAFQSQLAARQEQIFSGTVLPIKEKLTAIAHQALDLQADKLPQMEPKDLNAVAGDVLDRLGFGSRPNAAPGGDPAGMSVTVNVNADLKRELEEARKYIGARPSTSPALEVIVDGQPAPLGIGVSRPEEVHVPSEPDERLSVPAIAVAPKPRSWAELAEGD